MKIVSAHIEAFGNLVDRDFTFTDGINLVSGSNEAGKSTLASFLKFMLYGLSTRVVDGISERRRYVNWDVAKASGSIVFEAGQKTYTAERTLERTDENGTESYRETVAVRNENGLSVICKPTVGEFFLGVGEDVFLSTVYVKQAGGARIDEKAMTEALSNLLLSGSEEQNVGKAVDNLDKMRRTLLHKNGNGGTLSDLSVKRAELSAQLKVARTAWDRADEAKARLAGVESDLETAKKEAATLNRRIKAARIKEKMDATGSSESLKEEIAEAERYSGSDERYRNYLEALRASENEVANTKDRVAHSAPNRHDEEIHTLNNRAKRRYAFATVLLVFDLFIIYYRACLAPYIRGTNLTKLEGIDSYVIVSLVLCFLAAVLFLMGTAVHRKHPGLKEEIRHSLDRRMIYPGDQRDYDNAVRARDNLIRRIFSDFPHILDGVSSDGSLSGRVIGALTDKVTEFGKPREDLSTLRSRLAAAELLEAEYAKYEPETASVADLHCLAGDAHKRIETLRREQAEWQKRLGAAENDKTPTVAIAQELSEADSRYRALYEKYEAYCLAKETLAEASDEVKASLTPKIRVTAGSLLSHTTSGKYDTLVMDDDMKLFLNGASGVHEIVSYSTGTCEMTYLCLRIALLSVLFRGNQPPVVLDETFAHTDDERLSMMLESLRDGNFCSQVFILTSQKREREMIADANYIEMDKNA